LLAAAGAAAAGGCKYVPGSGARRIEVPAVATTPEPLTRLDALFASAKAGRTIRFDLVMRDVAVRRIAWCNAVEVAAGSVTFHSRGGYFRFLSGGRVASKPAPDRPESMLEFRQGASPNVSVWCIRGLEATVTTLHVNDVVGPGQVDLPDGRHPSQDLSHEQTGPTTVIRVRAEFSADFQGRVANWEAANVK
jgi:hypothetical protein